MRKTIAIFVSLTLFTLSSRGQVAEEPFKMTAKPTITIHSNFATGLNNSSNISGFNLERTYLGTTFVLSETLSGRVRFDVGSTNLAGSDLEMVAYVKNAEIKWKEDNFTLNAGMISTIQFAAQEKFWGYRYLLKSFQDEYKFGSSADLGVSAAYKFSDMLTIDATVINGEGYKKVNKDDAFRYGGGFHFTPIEPLLIRAYYDRYDVASGAVEIAQENVSLFVGLSQEPFSIGAEYNILYNASKVSGNDLYGYSVYSTVQLPKDFEVYMRWDYMYSRNDYHIAKDGQLGVLGLQYSVSKYVQLSPNFRLWQPASGGEATLTALVNLHLNF